MGSAFVAGTGTIAVDAQVGQIDGITHKDGRCSRDWCFWCPQNCYEAEFQQPAGLGLVKVRGSSQAVNALHRVGIRLADASCARAAADGARCVEL